MATYKLIQDIEAEDKILGPLTLRQFIFAMIAVFMFYLCFVVVVKHVFFMLVLFLPPALFFGFFALPFGRDQPTEVWALAKLRFWFKPRQRVWNQSGIKEMVTITVPKKVERVLTNGLSETEVNSRLSTLAQTLDSRGWVVKHVASDVYTPAVMGGTSDRLISFDSLPQEVPVGDPGAATDMLDTNSNPIARQFDTMINQSAQARREELMSQMRDDVRQAAAAPAPVVAPPGSPETWFTGRRQAAPVAAVPRPTRAPATDSSADRALSARLAASSGSRQVSFGNLRTVKPLAPQAGAPAPAAVPTAGGGQTNRQSTTMTASSDAAILSLARNDDLNVATLARQAQKKKAAGSQSPDEVVITLH